MRGIQDLLDKNNVKKSRLRIAMMEAKVPFPCENHANVYSLIDAQSRPKDPYVYIFLSKYLGTTLEEMILRYSEIEEVKEVKSVRNITSGLSW